MAAPPPPDLSRLGDAFTAAVARRVRAERRRRIVIASVVGALAFAALTPGALDPAHREQSAAVEAIALAPLGCDQPAGAKRRRASCDAGTEPPRQYAWRLGP
jgi:hypothetical protein